MYRVKVGCAWITDIKDYQSQRVGAAAVITGHFHVRRHRDCVTSIYRDWLPSLHFQRECALQDIDSDWKTVRMEQGLIARLEVRGQHAHLLPLALGHALNHLAKE
jgi:hypothetical protein